MTTVTANTRLARRLRREFDREREAAGDTFWEPPDILPWRAWIRRLWDDVVYEGRDDRVLLSPAQELVLWQQAIGSSEAGSELLNPEGTAKIAAEAWMLLHTWRLPLAEAAFSEVPDTSAFYAWAGTFQSALKARGFITEAEVPDALLELGFESPAACAGFDEMTPVERALLAQAEEVELPYLARPRRQQCALPDTPDEIRASARWARRQLEENPAAQIGLVFPGLAARRAAVSRIFAETLGTSEAFHISTPVPLNEVPLVQAALLALKQPLGLTFAEAGQKSRSPYFRHSPQEGARRDLRLRRLRVSRSVEESREPIPPPQRPGAWSGTFSRMVTASGWPGTRGLDSAEYQAAEAWKELLGEFARLDAVLGDLEHAAALSWLLRLASETGFGTEERGEPVQIMGVLEASGSRFDALWIGGLHDDAWPPAARPHPFLPLRLQRAAGIPRSSVDLQFAQSKRVTLSLLRSAREVVCSYPLHEGEMGLRPSPFLSGMPPAVPEAHTAVEQAATLEELSGEIAPPLGEQRFVKGGMSVIADQSACPFRAFVRYRLGARGLDELEPGLTPAERGNVAHAALQSIWDALRTQRQLIESDPDDLRELLSRSVGKALAEKLEEGSKALTKTRELETRRLTRLLMEWLEIEKKRPPFQTWQLEVRQVREFGGVELEIRADRVDQYCEDGSLAILDYKTGNTSKPTQWEGERPEAPQLPLYSTVMKEPISTIAFAQLAAGELRLNGFSECGDSGLKPFKGCPLPEQIGIWREVVHALGAAFAEGHATVDPNKKACARCDLHGLCRVAELGREASDE